MEKLCKLCGNPVINRAPQAKYCSIICTQKAQAPGRNCWNKNNPEKMRKATERHRIAYPDRVKKQNKDRAELKKNWKLLLRYGISLEEWKKELEKQAYKCKICGTEDPGPRGWNTDHCHKTNKFRGILCPACNIMLGMAKDSAVLLRKAAAYLKENK